MRFSRLESAQLELPTAKPQRTRPRSENRDKNGNKTFRGHRGENNHFAKLTEAEVRTIRVRYSNGERQVDLADEFGVAQPMISLLVRRKTWKTVL